MPEPSASPLNSSTSDVFLRRHAVAFYVSDLIRHLAATCAPCLPDGSAAAAGGGGLASGGDGRVGTPLTLPCGPPQSPCVSSPIGTVPSSAPASSVQTSNVSGVYSPTSPHPGASVGIGAPAGIMSALPAVSSVSSQQLLQASFAFDDVLSEMAQYFQDVYSGAHTAGLGCPFEYVLATHRNRLALCWQIHRAVCHVLPKLITPLLSERTVAARSYPVSENSPSLLDAASMVLEASASSSSSGRIPLAHGSGGGLDCASLLYNVVLAHCADMPRGLFDAALRQASLADSPAHRKLLSAEVLQCQGTLKQHALIQRSVLLHVCCREMVEDLCVAFSPGGGGALPEKCRSDILTWRRAFERWGLEGSWRCGPNRATSLTSAYSVEPYPPLAVLNSVFGQLAFGATVLLDADHVASLFIRSDEFFLWVTADHPGLASAALL